MSIPPYDISSYKEKYTEGGRASGKLLKIRDKSSAPGVLVGVQESIDCKESARWIISTVSGGACADAHQNCP